MRRILVDRHQADLLWSLQRLFEDRFGFELYVPVGLGWWEAEVWQFGACFGDDRLAQQYLVPWDGVWENRGDGTYVTYDGCHPERPIVGIEYEAARQLDWEFLMPTVQENQGGYHRLADELGARYALQVGNTGQWIDWSLNPLALVSAEMPFPEDATAIRYHQEMDLAAYPLSPPGYAWFGKVVSFLNLLDRIPQAFADFQTAKTTLGPEGWTFERYGHEQEGGFLAPVSEIGKVMSGAMFGWHDKPVGDGFGHVIHAWAAVGRPVVGHAEYYAGKLAEPFWKDGETCFDLGARDLPETIQLLRDVAADADRYSEMCAAMRAAFDATVDYDAEADAVMKFLDL